MRSLSCVLFGFFLCIGTADAQQLIGIRIDQTEIPIGKSVQIIVDFKSLGVVNGACGLLINFGDGASESMRAEENHLPVRIARTYNNVGTFRITAEGKAIFRGLNSVLGCLGGDQSTVVNVRPEDYAEKKAAAQAEMEAARKQAAAIKRASDEAAKSAAAERAAAESALQQANAVRAAADKKAQKAVADRKAAERALAAKNKPSAATAATKPAATEPSTKAKQDQPKPKSSLDL